MSADRWSICPKCNYRDPDRPSNDDEYQGSLRFDFDIDFAQPEFDLHINCANCGFSKTFTQNDL